MAELNSAVGFSITKGIRTISNTSLLQLVTNTSYLYNFKMGKSIVKAKKDIKTKTYTWYVCININDY